MARCGLNSESPAAVAKQMSDLILCFPAAAVGGVRWSALISKYNERHSTTLDVSRLGHSSPLAAATALLWDVLRVVDTSDPENPVLAVEDCVAMTAQAGASATWPSLYQSLCQIVSENGSNAEEDVHIEGDKISSAILVSQLKPLLQRHWHSDFDECSLSYLSEDGKPVRVKKMKHLLLALLQWREQRVGCQVANKDNELDKALGPQLELVPSKKRNDLLLRCVWPRVSSPSASSASSASSATGASSSRILSEHVESCMPGQSMPTADNCDSSTISTSGSTDLMQELEMLRAENASLRSKNSMLECQAQDDVFQKRAFDIPADLPTFEPIMDVWGDQFEPPAFEYCGSGCVVTPSNGSSRSTAVPSSVVFTPGELTPSIAATPTMWVWDGQSGQVCSMVPMWYVMGDRGLHDVPSGTVQQAVTTFENDGNKVLPSFFTMGVRDV